MHGKKGDALVLVIIIFMLLLLVGAVFFAIKYKQVKERKELEALNPPQPETVNLLLKSIDADTQEQVETDFTVFDGTNFVARGRTSRNTWTEAEIPINKTLEIYCWDKNNYYTSKKVDLKYQGFREYCGDKKDNDHDELYDEEDCIDSTSLCEVYATSKLNMSLSKPLEKNMDEEVELEITAPQNFLRMSLCTRWTVGFIYATFDNFVEECNTQQCYQKDNGKEVCQFGWLNWTDYYPKNHSFAPMPENIYRCNGEANQTCVQTDGRNCILPSSKEGGLGVTVPIRYRNLFDCFYTSKSLYHNSYTAKLKIKASSQLNYFDYVEVCAIDHDRYLQTDEWYDSDSQGNDVGANDTCIKFRYLDPEIGNVEFQENI